MFEQLNARITLQKCNKSSDLIGGYKNSWADACQVWAKIIQINNLATQIKSKKFRVNFFKFIMRKNSIITSGMRIKAMNKAFNIESVNHVLDNSGYLEVIAYEVFEK